MFTMSFGIDTWFCWTRTEAGDAVIAVVHGLLVCRPVVLFFLSAEVALQSSRKALSVFDIFLCWSKMVDRYNFLWIGRIYGRSRI